MKTVINSGRFYFWPIIALNMATMTIAVEADVMHAIKFSLMIACLSSFGFLINDLWDRAIDGINQAGHFENSNSQAVRMGMITTLFFLTVGLVGAYLLGWSEFILSLCIALGLASYTIILRRYLLLPTILAATLACSPLWIPLLLWAKNGDGWKWTFVVSTIVIIAGREIFMDTRDRIGDLIGGRDTFATVFGPNIAKLAGLILTVSACIPFILIVISLVRYLPMLTGLLPTIAVLIAILYLLLEPAATILSATSEERASIQRFVMRSRIAMVLIPILVFLLWRT